jgi:hypothetical protein
LGDRSPEFLNSELKTKRKMKVEIQDLILITKDFDENTGLSKYEVIFKCNKSISYETIKELIEQLKTSTINSNG